MEKFCKQCGKSLRNNQKSFCSKECKTIYYNGSNFNRQCKVCNHIFKGTRFQNYCSSKCKGVVQKNKDSNKTLSVCIVCGCDIIGSKTKKYCSRSCQNKNASIKTCITCGNEFKGSYSKKYCSEECVKQSVKNSVESNKNQKIINAETNIAQMYPSFNIKDIGFIKDIIWVQLECRIDGHVVHKKYDKLSNEIYECETCQVSQYHKQPSKCAYCNSIFDFNNRNQEFCSVECRHSKHRDDIDHLIKQNTTILNTSFQKGYTELKVSEITSLSVGIIKKYLNLNPHIKYNLDLLEDTVIDIIKNNQYIDFKSQHLTRVASSIFKDRYINMSNFLCQFNVDCNDKFFKCAKCGEYHKIHDFHTRQTIIQKSFFGIGICKTCIKLEKDKRKRNSAIVDSMLTTKYTLHIRDRFNNKCAICEEVDNIHIDHFIPLAWKMPSPIQGNYILLCDKCNVSHKRDLNIKEWLNTYSTDYTKQVQRIMSWLASENRMSLEEYSDLYWACYHNYISHKKC